MDFEQLEQLASAVESIVTALGIILGGIWAYSRFVWHRERNPQAQISQDITQRSLENGFCLIHVKVTIKNIGKVLIPLRLVKTLLFRILPLETQLAEKIKNGQGVFSKDRTVVPWPQIDKRVWEWAPGEAEIEPGEIQDLNCEFLVPFETVTVQIETYLEDSIRGDIGWTGVNLVDVQKYTCKEDFKMNTITKPSKPWQPGDGEHEEKKVPDPDKDKGNDKTKKTKV